MCEIKSGQNYTLAAEREVGIGMGNGDGGNKLFNGSSLLAKVMAGVVTILIISGLAFGARVYAFMEAGPRFSSEDYLRAETKQSLYIHSEFMPRDVYEVNQLRAEEHRVRIQEQLNEMDEKLDALLRSHNLRK